MKTSPHSSFLIGDWVVQPDLNRLIGAGRVVSVEPKMMQVLLRLAEQRGAVVTRANLLETVWAGTVVGDEVLSRVISELRKVLGDDARAPHLIETIPRVGYRLIAPVAFGVHQGDQLAGPVLSAGSMETNRMSQTLPSSSWWNRASVAVLILLTAGGVWMARSSVPSKSHVVHVLPLTTYPGFEIDPALSPDGQHVAFIWSGPDERHLNLYVRHVANDALLQLTDTPFYTFSPAWSPDGSRIVFARALQGIFEVPALGGPARKLADVGASSWADVAWSPDGESLVYTDRTSPQAPYRLVRMDIATRDTTHLTRPTLGFTGDRDPVFSPDSRRIAFVRVSDEVGEVFVIPTMGGAPRPLTDDQAVLDGISWTSDGRSLIFASNRRGPFALWKIDVEGRAVVPLRMDGVDDLRAPTIQDNRIAFIQSSIDTNIWRLNVSSGKAERFIASTRHDENPRYSPDGRYIAFVSSRSGSSEVWIAGTDGNDPAKFTNFGGSARADSPAWSPDSRSLVFSARIEGQTDLYRLEIDGSVPRRLTSDPAREISPAWSPDGRWIYFGTNRADTAHSGQLARVAASGGEPVPWAAVETSALQIAHDGTMYLTRADSTGLWRVRPGRSAEFVVDLSPSNQANWTLTPEGLYFIRQGEVSTTVERLDLETGVAKTLVSFSQAPARQGLAVSPDERYVLFTHLDHSRQDLVLVEEGI